MNKSLVIVDLEATCCNKKSVPRHEMEIIEIGAVQADSVTGEIISEFEAFVQPVRHPVLTEFCTELTSITQQDVNRAKGYPEVIASFKEWLTEIEVYDFCSWGAYDKSQFEQDCQFHNIPYPFIGKHRNLKIEFSEALGVKKKFGLAGAIKHLGLEFEGTHHRGIDDARNIARIYAKVFTMHESN